MKNEQKPSKEWLLYNDAINAIWKIFDDVEMDRPTLDTLSEVSELLYQERKKHA